MKPAGVTNPVGTITAESTSSIATIDPYKIGSRSTWLWMLRTQRAKTSRNSRSMLTGPCLWRASRGGGRVLQTGRSVQALTSVPGTQRIRCTAMAGRSGNQTTLWGRREILSLIPMEGGCVIFAAGSRILGLVVIRRLRGLVVVLRVRMRRHGRYLL